MSANQQYGIDELIYLMQRLRDPKDGCPWDLKQDYRSITPSTIEEAYEVVDAIEHGDLDHLREELGDLLFQSIFYAQLASEEGRFDFHDVVHTLTAKLIRRHPHVFPAGTLDSRRDPDDALDDKAVKASWEAIKQAERHDKGKKEVFADIPRGLPAITRAAKLQKRAAKHGFDWPNLDGVLAKLDEEVRELKDAQDKKEQEEFANELGDVLFTCVNLARHIGKDAESLLRAANQRFQTRYEYVYEQEAAHIDSGVGSVTLEQRETWWQQAKKQES